MAGGLILCLCMLTLCALPTETAAHTDHRIDEFTTTQRNDGNVRPDIDARINSLGLEARGLRYTTHVDNYAHALHPNRAQGRIVIYAPDPANDIIQWIRVYKNPKIVENEDLSRFSTDATTPVAPVYDFSPHGLTGWSSFLMPSYENDEEDGSNNLFDSDLFWVQFKPSNHPDDPGGLIDTGENSGLVTATENTSVQVGDLIAIAVRVKGLGVRADPDITIGPPVEMGRTYTFRNIDGDESATVHQEREWRLNPNMPIWRINTTGGVIVATQSVPWGVSPLNPTELSTYEHTLVYQFRVAAEHIALNNDGPWLKRDFSTSKMGVTQGVLRNTDPGGPNPPVYESVVPGIDWLWDEAEGVTPSSTAVIPFNAFTPHSPKRVDWGVKSTTSSQGFVRDGWASYTEGAYGAQLSTDHRHPVLYDPADGDNEPIYYPVIIAGESEQVASITDVPDASVTGSFTVGLHFANRFASGDLFVGHNVSEEGVAALRAALAAKLADLPFEVTSLSYVGGIQTPASLATGARFAGTSTQYTLTLEPRLGLKGDIALKTPVPTEDELADSERILIPGFEVMVPVDTSLRLAGDVVEPSGTYLAGDEVVVRVPFAADGLTYEGDEPPYITIYLGAQTDENRRHATWQRGDETPGSTVVPFVYVIDAEDPVASSVNVNVNTFAVPAGTTLRSGAGLSLVGTAAAPMDSGEEAPAPSTDGPAGPVLSDPSGLPPPVIDSSLDVVPLVLLPSEEEPSEPKAAASSVPRSPVVFNELGNGSGASNDWLEIRNVTGSAVSLKDWELSVVQDGMKEDTSLIVFPDVSVPANGLLLITNSDPSADGNMLAGGEQKGLTHHYIVNAGLSLPDDGKFLLILRNAKEKLGLNEAFIDVAGGGGSGTDAFVRETTGDYDTHVWPLQVLESPGDNTEDALSAGKVWLRAKADVVGYHKDAWGEAAFTGVGYDRMVSKSDETAGTPGYPNGAVKTEAATPRGALTFSEVMLDSAGGTLPQWIELYNSSKTDALNLERWKLEIQNVDSEDLVGRPVVTLTLEAKVIQPNQTLLIVAGNARASSADVFPADRVYNLLALHEKNLRIKSARDTFLSAKGFYLKLIDRNGNVVDEIGNTDGDRRTQDEPIWALPVLTNEGPRSSIIRRYDKGVVSDGASRFGWVLSANFKQFKTGEAVVADTLYYGHADDVGSPGYRQGGALPVELSGVSVTREENGAVLLTWTTESEVDNAGFNVRRSLRRDSGYALVNPVLIAGAGTTGERQTYTFIDTSAKPGVEHYYQLEEVSLAGQPQVLVTRRLRGPVSPAHRALKTLGEVKQVK